jgi:hypothetical protein
MIVVWKIRCFHRERKEWFDRRLCADTSTLDPVTRHLVEFCMEDSNRWEEILTHRNAFHEGPAPTDLCGRGGAVYFGVPNYFEDETGVQITLNEVAQVVTGLKDAIAVQTGLREDEIRLFYGGFTVLPASVLSGITLDQSEVDALASFLRDADEIRGSEFMRSPPQFTTSGLRSISSEYIIAFVTVFRRLYLEKERGNFNNACKLYVRHFPNQNVAAWVAQERRQYQKELSGNASMLDGTEPVFSFTNRSLINIFLYTKFVHQPSPERIREYQAALAEAGPAGRLEWSFYMRLFHLAIRFVNVASYVRKDVENYFALSGITPSFDVSPFLDGCGRGTMLTANQREEKAVSDRAEKLAQELWVEAGSPANQLPRFFQEAKEMLRKSQHHGATNGA